MEERDTRVKNRQKVYNKKDNVDDSRLSANSEIYNKRPDYDIRDQRTVSDTNMIDKHTKQNLIEDETKNYIEEMKKGTYNILVAVRCRPLSAKEKEFSEFEIVKILDKKMVILIDPYEYNGPSDVFKNRSREQQYAFDFAFDKTCSQHNVFNSTTKFLLDGVVNGYNATVFAYGSTGAGKTFTMLGTEDEEGIMVLTLQELFDKISFYSSDREYKVKLWYLEIYNENIRDLLSPNEENCDLREDPTKGVSVSNISELVVTSCKDIMQLLKKGNRSRTQEATNANETSSRSHAILQVHVEHKDKVTGLDAEIKVGKLSLIDLAGSERASATQNRGMRLIEGANINRSLLTLGNCINALCEANEKGTKPYIPYRDSKLTRLLKDSLGGNSRTVMIANISPSVTTFDDTYNTLKYANRAKNIKTTVQRNVVNVQYHISNYNQIITSLKNEISELKAQLAKKDYSLNNIVPAKVPEPKKEESKEPIPKSVNSNAVNIVYFEKAVAELKTHCEEELSLKQKIIDQEQELNSMNHLLKRNKNDLINFSLINLGNNLRIHTDSINNNNQNNFNDDLTNLNLEDRDILVNPNINSSLISNIPIINVNNSTNVNDMNSINLSNAQKEIEGKIALMKKNLEKNVERFKEMVKKREQSLNTYFKNGIKDFHFEYLQSILKAHNLKIFIIENRFKEKFNYIISEVKENYISVLEGQLKIRDDLIKKTNLPNIFDEESDKIRSVDQLKYEFSHKLPLILNHKIVKDNNSTLDLNFSNISSNNLPPIGRNNINIQSLLSDIKLVNNNISKIENDSRIRDGHIFNNNQNQNYKNKLKSDYVNINKLENQNSKYKYARNYSQGVRNSNMALISNKNEQSPISGNLLPSGLNGMVNSGNHNINTSNYNSNQISLNQRMQQNKYLSNKNVKKTKNLNLNLINQRKKESNSEKSDSHNLSNEYDSYIIDLDNSGDDTQIRKIKHHILERKSAQPKSNLRDDNSMYSPLRKEYQKNIGTILRKEADALPQLKKKDLNVFLNERNKNKNLKKIPFKI